MQLQLAELYHTYLDRAVTVNCDSDSRGMDPKLKYQNSVFHVPMGPDFKMLNVL